MDTQKEMDMVKLTNSIQAEALKLLDPDCNPKLVNEMIFTFGHEWRVIINQFLEDTGTPPTPDDLIWCSSLDEHLGCDIRIIVHELKQAI